MTAASVPAPSGLSRPTARTTPRGQIALPAMLVAITAALLAYGIATVAPRGWPSPAGVPVELQGRHYRLPPGDIAGLQAWSASLFGAGEAAARDTAAAAIDAQLDPVFAHAYAAIPAFADWYYTLGAEYARLGTAALSLAGLADPGYVAQQAAQRLLPDDAWQADLQALEAYVTAQLSEHNAQVRVAWLTQLTGQLAANRIPSPLPAEPSAEPSLRVDQILADIVMREQQILATRASLSTIAAGGALVAPTLLRTLGAAPWVARITGRGAARAGTAALGGAALCSLAGPLALGCALVAGAAAWLATDWALLRLEEYLRRDELIEALHAGLDLLREQLRRDLTVAYDELIDRYYAAIGAEIQQTFVPARAGVN